LATPETTNTAPSTTRAMSGTSEAASKSV
jgi:hypothetical protein